MITNEGTEIDSITICYGSNQFISDPIYILANSHSSIDLMFTN